VRKPEGNRPLGIPRRRWEDNIKMDLKEIRWGFEVFTPGGYEEYHLLG
jgi:hypothetical protein